MESTKNSDVRMNNRKRVINTLFREGPMTKQDIATRLEISPPTVTLLLKELMEKKFITKGEVLKSTGGRKPIRMTPVYNLKYSIALEVTMHETRIALVDLGGNIIVSEKYPLVIDNTEAPWGKINETLNSFIDSYVNDRDKLLDIGITLQLSMKDGKIVEKEGMPDRYKLNLEMVRESFDYPVNILSSAKMAAIAQVWALNDRDNFVFLTLGSYVAGAIVYNNEIIDFQDRNGEYGDMIIDLGTKVRVSDYCMIDALCERAGVASLSDFFEGINEGDQEYVKLWNEYLDVVCLLLHNLHCIFGWKIIIGGSMSPYLEASKEAIKERLRLEKDYIGESISYFEISDLGEFGAAVGAALLSIDHFLNNGFNEL